MRSNAIKGHLHCYKGWLYRMNSMTPHANLNPLKFLKSATWEIKFNRNMHSHITHLILFVSVM